MNDTNKRWYVAYVADTKRISALPEAVKSAVQDSAVWVPTKTTYLRVDGRVQQMTSLVYAIGYVFVNVDIDAGNVEDAVKTACGGTFLKGPGGKHPKPLTEIEINDARKIASDFSTPQFLAQHYGLEEGQGVEIVEGSLMGFSGKINKVKKTSVIVEVNMFGKDILVEVDPTICRVVTE